MDELIKHVHNIISMDRATLGVLAALCALAAYALKDFMANPVLIIFVYPILYFFSVLFQHGIILMEIYPPRKLDLWLMWTIMASICGNIVGIAVVASFGRLTDSFSTFKPYKPDSGRTR